jgi:hypothetical protein
MYVLIIIIISIASYDQVFQKLIFLCVKIRENLIDFEKLDCNLHNNNNNKNNNNNNNK